MLYPFLMEPCYKDYIWGGKNLERLGKRLPNGKTAESWEVAALPEGESRIANGYLSGKSLREAVDLFPLCVLGKNDDDFRFPLLFKLIDANESLSVQVHPDDTCAQVYENEPYGKHEAWYIIEAEPHAEIIYGLVPGTDRRKLRRMVNDSRIEMCLNKVRVHSGDVIDIPPGTIHAIGKGIVLAEIQQSSNLTYRVYDYNRKDVNGRERKLHIDKALEVIKTSAASPFAEREVLCETGSSVITRFLRNKYFELNHLNIKQFVGMDTEKKRFQILFVSEGKADIVYDNGMLNCKTGDTILIPAALGKYAIIGKCSVLLMFVPD